MPYFDSFSVKIINLVFSKLAIAMVQYLTIIICRLVTTLS